MNDTLIIHTSICISLNDILYPSQTWSFSYRRHICCNMTLPLLHIVRAIKIKHRPPSWPSYSYTFTSLTAECMIPSLSGSRSPTEGVALTPDGIQVYLYACFLYDVLPEVVRVRNILNSHRSIQRATASSIYLSRPVLLSSVNLGLNSLTRTKDEIERHQKQNTKMQTNKTHLHRPEHIYVKKENIFVDENSYCTLYRCICIYETISMAAKSQLFRCNNICIDQTTSA